MTRGEMRLALLSEQAGIYAAAFPENREYAQAKNMLINALRAGVSNGVNFVGSLNHPLLQQVAGEIAKASRQQQPASKGGLLGRVSLGQGVNGIGDPEFKFNFDHDCVQYATKAANAKYSKAVGTHSWQWWENNVNDSQHRRYYREQKSLCKTRIEIEAIVNSKITDASHHVLYYGLNQAFNPIKNSLVITKHLFHIGGIQGLANATDLDRSLMGSWTETSILRRNSTANVGPVGSITSSFFLAPDPEKMQDDYQLFQKVRGGSGVNGLPRIGEPVTLAAITALVTAISAAIGKAADFQRSLNEKKNGAMSAAQNYGTSALEALKTDYGTPPGTPPSGTGLSNNTLLLAAAAAGAYLLLND